jgi:hypothetical protein
MIYFGDSEMSYQRKIVFDSSSSNSYSLDFGDINNNGNIDIVIGNSGEPNTVFLNYKKGTSWKKIILNKKDFYTYDIILADLNNDQKIDIIESNSDAINYYYLTLLKK